MSQHQNDQQKNRDKADSSKKKSFETIQVDELSQEYPLEFLTSNQRQGGLGSSDLRERINRMSVPMRQQAVMQLQRTLGNAATANLLKASSTSIHRKPQVQDDLAVESPPQAVITPNGALEMGDSGHATAVNNQIEGGKVDVGRYASAVLVPVPQYGNLFEGRIKTRNQQQQQYAAKKNEGLWVNENSVAWRTDNEREGLAKSHAEQIAGLRERAKGQVTAFNGWVPMGNQMIGSLMKLDTMSDMLGVGAPDAMVGAIQSALEDAKKIISSSKGATGKKITEDSSFTSLLPKIDESVSSYGKKVSSKLSNVTNKWQIMRSKLLVAQPSQLASEMAEEEFKDKGDDDETKQKLATRKKEIQDQINAAQNIGKTIDTAINFKSVESATSATEMLKAGRDAANAGGPIIPTNAAELLKGITEIIHMDELKKIEAEAGMLQNWENTNAAIAGKLEVAGVIGDFKTAVTELKDLKVDLDAKLKARIKEYLTLGEKLDELAQKQGKVGYGKERFKTVMMVCARVRELIVMGNMGKDAAGFSDNLPSGALSGDMGTQADQLIEEMYIVLPMRLEGTYSNLLGLAAPTSAETAQLSSIVAQVGAWKKNQQLLQDTLGKLDSVTAQFMAEIGGSAEY